MLPYILTAPALLVCIGILAPFIHSLAYSFQRYRLSMPQARRYAWFANYESLWGDPAFWTTLRVSLVYTVATVGVQLLLGLFIAFLLKERTRLNNIISVSLLLPLMTAPVIAAIMWKLMVNPGFGILGWLTYSMGFVDFKWTADPQTAMFTVVLVDTWIYTPFMTILLLAGLRSLPPQPFEAAQLDGIHPVSVFFRITLPMLAPYIVTASLFRVLDSSQQFDIVYAMTQGGPGDSLMLFQIKAYLEFFQYTNVGRSAAILIILWVITYVISTLFINNWLALREKTHARG